MKNCTGNYKACDLSCEGKQFPCENEGRRKFAAGIIKMLVPKDGIEVKSFMSDWDKTDGFFRLAERQAVRKARSARKRNAKECRIQETPITVDNFFNSTKGTFKELESIPEGFKKFFSSRSSHYYTDESNIHLVRISDHWGSEIRFCAWYLEGYEIATSWTWQKRHGKQNKIGIIKYSELEVNPPSPPSAPQRINRNK